MIQLLVDEAYAFDYLSILEIKKDINSNTYSNWEACKANIQQEVGKEKMLDIINSEEYKLMIETNKLTFVLSYQNRLEVSVIIICFGTNDAKSYLWNEAKFYSDYKKFILKCIQAYPLAKIYILIPPPALVDKIFLKYCQQCVARNCSAIS